MPEIVKRARFAHCGRDHRIPHPPPVHDEILAAGGRVVGISVDTPGQHAALLEKLRLPPALGLIEPGPHAMPAEQLFPYFRGAQLAAVAMARRHPEIKKDAADYMAEMDRYVEAVKRLQKEKTHG